MIAAFESRLEFVRWLSGSQIEQLWRMFQSEPWRRGCQIEDVRRAIEHSDLIFPLCDRETGRLAAFARVLTDFVYNAFILDLVIDGHDPNPRLGKLLVDAITAHPALLFVEHLDLACRDEMVPVFESLGFNAESRGAHRMRKIQPPLLAKHSIATKAS